MLGCERKIHSKLCLGYLPTLTSKSPGTIKPGPPGQPALSAPFIIMVIVWVVWRPRTAVESGGGRWARAWRGARRDAHGEMRMELHGRDAHGEMRSVRGGSEVTKFGHSACTLKCRSSDSSSVYCFNIHSCTALGRDVAAGLAPVAWRTPPSPHS